VDLHPEPDAGREERRAREAERKRRQVAKWKRDKEESKRAAKRKEEEEERRRKMQEARRRKVLSLKKVKLAAYQLERERERELDEKFQASRAALRARTAPQQRVDLTERVRKDLSRAKVKRAEDGAHLSASERGRREREATQKRMVEAMAATALAGGGGDGSPNPGGGGGARPPPSTASTTGTTNMAWLGVTRDPNRLTSRTQAARRREFSAEELDARDERREKAGAHDRSIPLMTRDRVFVGRATPSWRRGVA